MKRSLVFVAMLSLAVLSSAAHAGGSHFHFSLGGPHCGWGHHCPPWPRSYVFDFAPRPVYVYQPVVQPVVPAYAAPAYSAAPAPAPATSNWSSRTEPRTNALPASQPVTSTVTIRNPANSGGAVAFVVDEAREVSLNAGQTQTLTNKASYTIEFDRGADYGLARKTLSGGAYEFTVTERGWDLIDADRVATKPTVRRNELPTIR